MYKYLVGSRALNKFNLSRKEPKDWDWWISPDYTGKLSGDMHVIPLAIMELLTVENNVVTPDDIYTIKCSHLGWDNPMWEKHKLDILWLKSNGCTLNTELFNRLVSFWKVELNDKSFLSLSKSKEGFFNDHVEYIYDHDYLHELCAYPNKPMYTKCLKDNEDVLINKDKFDSLIFENQVRMFREEITVIACERWLLNPKSSIDSWCKAHSLALRKTITNLTKGWATNFIVLNLEEFVKPDYSYFENILDTLK